MRTDFGGRGNYRVDVFFSGDGVEEVEVEEVSFLELPGELDEDALREAHARPRLLRRLQLPLHGCNSTSSASVALYPDPKLLRRRYPGRKRGERRANGNEKDEWMCFGVRVIRWVIGPG